MVPRKPKPGAAGAHKGHLDSISVPKGKREALALPKPHGFSTKSPSTSNYATVAAVPELRRVRDMTNPRQGNRQRHKVAQPPRARLVQEIVQNELREDPITDGEDGEDGDELYMPSTPKKRSFSEDELAAPDLDIRRPVKSARRATNFSGNAISTISFVIKKKAAVKTIRDVIGKPGLALEDAVSLRHVYPIGTKGLYLGFHDGDEKLFPLSEDGEDIPGLEWMNIDLSSLQSIEFISTGGPIIALCRHGVVDNKLYLKFNKTDDAHNFRSWAEVVQSNTDGLTFKMKSIAASLAQKRFDHTKTNTLEYINETDKPEKADKPDDIALIEKNIHTRKSRHMFPTPSPRTRTHTSLKDSMMSGLDETSPLGPEDSVAPAAPAARRLDMVVRTSRATRQTRKEEPSDHDEAKPALRWSVDNVAELKRSWGGGPQTLTYHRNNVEKTDIARLDNDQFLNDNLLNFYMRYLQIEAEKRDPSIAKRVHLVNTYFWTGLESNEGYSKVKGWTSRIDIPSFDYIVVPINESFHWYLAIICNTPSLLAELEQSDDPAATPNMPPPFKIITLDSLGGGHSSTCTKLKNYIVADIEAKRKVVVRPKRKVGVTATGIPVQSNLSDCGLFSLGYLERFLENPDEFVNALIAKEPTMWNLNAVDFRVKLRDLLFRIRQENRAEGKSKAAQPPNKKQQPTTSVPLTVAEKPASLAPAPAAVSNNYAHGAEPQPASPRPNSRPASVPPRPTEQPAVSAGKARVIQPRQADRPEDSEKTSDEDHARTSDNHVSRFFAGESILTSSVRTGTVGLVQVSQVTHSENNEKASAEKGQHMPYNSVSFVEGTTAQKDEAGDIVRDSVEDTLGNPESERPINTQGLLRPLSLELGGLGPKQISPVPVAQTSSKSNSYANQPVKLLSPPPILELSDDDSGRLNSRPSGNGKEGDGRDDRDDRDGRAGRVDGYYGDDKDAGHDVLQRNSPVKPSSSANKPSSSKADAIILHVRGEEVVNASRVRPTSSSSQVRPTSSSSHLSDINSFMGVSRPEWLVNARPTPAPKVTATNMAPKTRVRVMDQLMKKEKVNLTEDNSFSNRPSTPSNRSKKAPVVDLEGIDLTEHENLPKGMSTPSQSRSKKKAPVADLEAIGLGEDENLPKMTSTPSQTRTKETAPVLDLDEVDLAEDDLPSIQSAFKPSTPRLAQSNPPTSKIASAVDFTAEKQPTRTRIFAAANAATNGSILPNPTTRQRPPVSLPPGLVGSPGSAKKRGAPDAEALDYSPPSKRQVSTSAKQKVEIPSGSPVCGSSAPLRGPSANTRAAFATRGGASVSRAGASASRGDASDSRRGAKTLFPRASFTVELPGLPGLVDSTSYCDDSDGGVQVEMKVKGKKGVDNKGKDEGRGKVREKDEDEDEVEVEMEMKARGRQENEKKVKQKGKARASDNDEDGSSGAGGSESNPLEL